MPQSGKNSARGALRGAVIAGVVASIGAGADEPAALDKRFADTVRPFLETYCLSCHGTGKQKGELDLSPFTTVDAVVAGHRQWQSVLAKLEAGAMPPESAERRPAADLRRSVIDWIHSLRRREAARNAGDPGSVPPHRLSNAEYDYTIRDLTGVDIRPAREFPVDPANAEGFDNSGESLAMSSTLLEKHLEAARAVATHLVLHPRGLSFAPHPVVTDTDRDKYCVQRIVDFYSRQPTDLADYFLCAWRFRHRAELGNAGATLGDVAATGRVSARYLATVWELLTGSEDDAGPVEHLRRLWRDLPPPGGDGENDARRGCEALRDRVRAARARLVPEVKNLTAPGIAGGSQPFVLWKDRQLAANRRRFDPAVLARSGPEARSAKSASDAGLDVDAASPQDDGARQALQASLHRFCAVFPDAFYVSERGRVFLKEDNESEGRLLSAGFHLMFGYFRDDAPLHELILEVEEQRRLDMLWDELRFITGAPERQYKDFIFFERAEPPRFLQGAEFDFARSEDKDVTSEARMRQLAGAYLARARSRGATEPALDALEAYFRDISAEVRDVESARTAAEPIHLQALGDFAERAYRRPLTAAERGDLLEFYRTLRRDAGSSHDEALRDAVASVLVSPSFLFRGAPPSAGETAASIAPAADGTTPSSVPLSAHALASRLSYFLWSSMPDPALLARAGAGDLHLPEVLAAQVKRMLADDRVRGFAVEFGANWLDIRRFEEHNSVDRERFPAFTPELRRAMFEEPIRFFIDLVQSNRSILDFLHADHTFVNAPLAAHYGMPAAASGRDGWTRVDGAGEYGRGGLLPMAVFLTKNAPGLRTSPVKRGYWVIRRLLGELVPPPPPAVPELPASEEKLGELTLREALARHRQDRSCAGCHARFDSIGLALEGYGPVGERRTRDLGGKEVDTRAEFPGGSDGSGLDGLREYLRTRRQREFVDNFCRKLLAYALGRSLIVTDDAVLDEMRARLAASGYRFQSLVESIVTSPQFLRRRTRSEPDKG